MSQSISKNKGMSQSTLADNLAGFQLARLLPSLTADHAHAPLWLQIADLVSTPAINLKLKINMDLIFHLKQQLYKAPSDSIVEFNVFDLIVQRLIENEITTSESLISNWAIAKYNIPTSSSLKSHIAQMLIKSANTDELKMTIFLIAINPELADMVSLTKFFSIAKMKPLGIQVLVILTSQAFPASPKIVYALLELQFDISALPNGKQDQIIRYFSHFVEKWDLISYIRHATWSWMELVSQRFISTDQTLSEELYAQSATQIRSHLMDNLSELNLQTIIEIILDNSKNETPRDLAIFFSCVQICISNQLSKYYPQLFVNLETRLINACTSCPFTMKYLIPIQQSLYPILHSSNTKIFSETSVISALILRFIIRIIIRYGQQIYDRNYETQTNVSLACATLVSHLNCTIQISLLTDSTYEFQDTSLRNRLPLLAQIPRNDHESHESREAAESLAVNVINLATSLRVSISPIQKISPLVQTVLMLNTLKTTKDNSLLVRTWLESLSLLELCYSNNFISCTVLSVQREVLGRIKGTAYDLVIRSQSSMYLNWLNYRFKTCPEIVVDSLINWIADLPQIPHCENLHRLFSAILTSLSDCGLAKSKYLLARIDGKLCYDSNTDHLGIKVGETIQMGVSHRSILVANFKSYKFIN